MDARWLSASCCFLPQKRREFDDRLFGSGNLDFKRLRCCVGHEVRSPGRFVFKPFFSKKRCPSRFRLTEKTLSFGKKLNRGLEFRLRAGHFGVSCFCGSLCGGERFLCRIARRDGRFFRGVGILRAEKLSAPGLNLGEFFCVGFEFG